MKLIGFWLLVLLAVLVPATAAIATSMICPTVSVAKAPLRGLAAKTAHVAKHTAASGSHVLAAGSEAKAAKAAKAAKKAAPADPQADHCCDLNPCSQCAGCGTCASIAASAGLGAHVHPLVVARLPEGGGPRAEFLLSGQERPPRTS